MTSPGPAAAALEQPQPCRYCGQPAWLTDDSSALHPCCQHWAAELAAGRACPACAASRSYWRNRTTVKPANRPEIPGPHER